jgi:hypothetical protein
MLQVSGTQNRSKILDYPVICNRTGAVIGLQLPMRGLSGSLPPTTLLPLAPSLVYLDLRGNEITGAAGRQRPQVQAGAALR